MTFRFKYGIYNKLSKNKKAGFFIIIDDEFETIEYCDLDCNNKIVSNKYYNISNQAKKDIKQIIEDNNQIFNLNSYIYDKSEYSFYDQIFYFELNDKNRKIEGNNIFNLNDDNESISLLINVFQKIANILLKENFILKFKIFKIK